MTPIDFVFLFFFAVMIFSSILWLLTYWVHRDDVYGDPEPGRLRSVTVIIPAYNEEAHIRETLESVLALDYPDGLLEVIAVDDGSTDGTLSILQEFSDTIHIISQENQGKAAALNAALEHVETELVACMDADSFPEPDMLKRMVGYFDYPDVDGVTPALKVRNPRTWVQKIIWTEYVFQIFLRKMFAIFQAQYVLPGPGSLYRVERLKELGGWDETTLTEDMEVAFRLFAHGSDITNTTNAYVSTVSPASLRGLFRQRIRWYRGYIENVLKYRSLIGRREHGNLGFFLLPFNILWLSLILFFFGYTTWQMGSILLQLVNTYLLIGFLTPDLNLSVMHVTLFHLFFGLFFVVGIGTILISLRTAGEDIRPWTRKTHYLTFLVLYPFLFALFWVAAILEEVVAGDSRVW